MIHRLNCSPNDRFDAMQVRATRLSPFVIRFISRLDNRLHFTHDGALKNVRRMPFSSLLNSTLPSFLVSHHAVYPRHGGRCHSSHPSIDSFHRVEHGRLASIDLNLSFSLKCGQSPVAGVEEFAASFERSQSACERGSESNVLHYAVFLVRSGSRRWIASFSHDPSRPCPRTH